MTSSSVGILDPQQVVDGTAYWVQNSGASYGLQQTSANSLQFQVDAGDTWHGDDATKNRSEIASTQQIANGTPIHIQYNFDVENGAINTSAGNWAVLGQLHQNDGANAVSGPPPFGVQLISGKMAIEIGYTDASGANVNRVVWADSSLFVQGANYAMDISITFDPNGNGHLLLSRNGVTLVDYTGPLGYKGQTGVYWKEGIYRSATSSTETADFSNLSVTTGAPSQTAAPAAAAATSATVYSTTKDYDPATGKIVTQRVDYGDGSYAVTAYSNGVKAQLQTYYTNNTMETDLYNSDGSLYKKTMTNADHSTVADWYAGGLVTQHIETNNAGTQTLVEQFDAAGMIYKSQTAADGTVDSYKYDDSGNILQHSVRLPNYYQVVTTYRITGQNYTSQTVNFDASNHITSLQNYRSDGTMLYSQTFSGNGGKSTTYYDASGTVVIAKINAGADGSREVFDYHVQGQEYTSDHYLYDKTGQVTLLQRFRADGKILFDATFGPTGISHYYLYAASGLVRQMTTTYASGAKIIYDYAADAVTVLQERIYNASGLMTNITKYSASGITLFSEVFHSDGSSTASTYDANGALLQQQITNADQSGSTLTYAPTSATSPTSVTNFDASGRTVSRTIYNADGSREVDHLIVTGAAYASDKEIYNSAGILVSTTTFNANGSLASSQVSNADGSATSKTYDGNGTLLQTKIVYADGSRDYYQYGLTGNVVSTFTHLNPQSVLSTFAQVYADGHKTTTQYGIVGQPYSSQMTVTNAAGATQDIVQYNTDGTCTTAFDAAGVSLSFNNSADKITSFGGDTMTFASSIFRDTIQSFHGGNAAGHDTIVLSQALVADFSHLKISTAGTTTTVAIDSQHTFTLINPTAAVTAADFKFV